MSHCDLPPETVAAQPDAEHPKREPLESWHTGPMNARYQAAAGYLAVRLIDCPPNEIISTLWHGLELLGEILPATWGCVLEMETSGDALNGLIEWRQGQPTRVAASEMLVLRNRAWWQRLASHGEPLCLAAADLPDEMLSAKAFPGDNARGYLLVAPLSSAGRLIGALVFASTDETTSDHLAPMHLFAQLFAQAISRLQRETLTQEQRAFESYLADLETELVACAPAKIDRVISQSLERLGEQSGAERIRLAALIPEGQALHLIHEWCAPGIAPSAAGEWHAPLDLPKSSPPSNPPLRATALEPDAQTTYTEPLLIEGSLVGFLTLSNVTAPWDWPDAWRSRIERLAHVLVLALTRRDAEALLAQRADFDHYLSNLATKLISCPITEMGAVIETALATFGRLANIDGAALVLVGEDGLKFEIDHAWSTFDLGNDKIPEGLSLAHLPWWRRQIAQNRCIMVPDASKLPLEARRTRKVLESQGIRAALAVPMKNDDQLLGFLGLVTLARARVWGDIVIEQTQMLARILAHVIIRQRIDQQLVASERRLCSFVDAISEPAFVVDRELRFVLANEAIASRLGHTREELVGRDCLSDLAPEIAANRRAHLTKALVSGEREHFDDSRKGRQYVNTLYPIVNSSGEVGAIAVVAIDITARKAAENALLESQANLSRALNAAQLGVWSCDIATGLVRLSDIARDILGLDPDMGICNHTRLQVLVHPEDREGPLEQFMRDVHQRGKAQVHLRVIKPSGEVRETHVFGECVRDENGVVRNIVGLGQDVTERRRLERQAAHIGRTTAVANLAGHVAHDFGHYLTVISVAAELLLDEVAPDSVAHDQLERLMTAWEDAATLVRGLQTLSGQETRRSGPLALDILVRDSAPHLRALLRAGIDLSLELGAPSAIVKADGAQIRRVLLNLVSNANESLAERHDGARVCIETRILAAEEPVPSVRATAQPGEYVRITVQDNGIGMSPEEQARLFEPLSGMRRSKGRGLGMAIVEGIMAQHAGQIGVSSVLGEGTAIALYLPLWTELRD